jgi:hypothetical protein
VKIIFTLIAPIFFSQKVSQMFLKIKMDKTMQVMSVAVAKAAFGFLIAVFFLPTLS